jgi:NADPH-dependent curcumin reductase CurA
MIARAIVHEAPDQVSLREFELREPHGDEILIQTLYTCISPGTELRLLRSTPAGMPFIAGYANVGRVIARGGKFQACA